MACGDYDIVVLTETWLRPDIANTELASDYTIRSLRSNYTQLEQVVASVKLPDLTIYICGIYIRPNSHPDVYTMHSNAVCDICDRALDTDSIVVVGDYNLPYLSWTFDEDINSYLPSNASTEAELVFTETIAASGLHQINTLRNSNNRILDLAFVNDSCNAEIIEPPFPLLKLDAHHKPFVLRIQLVVCSQQVPDDSCDDPDFDFKRCDFTALNNLLSGVDWNEIIGVESTNCATAVFYEKVYEILRDNVPRKRRCQAPSFKHSWWTSELRRLRNSVRKARKVYFREKSSHVKEKLKHLEACYSECRIAAFRSYTDRIGSNLKQNPKSFWSYVKSRKSGSHIPENVSYGDLTATTPEEAANLFANFFRSVHSDDPPAFSATEFENISPLNVSLPPLTITPNDVLSALKKLDISKGAGTDRLPPTFLKECAESMMTPLSLIFNRSLIERSFPTMWKTASITPVHKSGGTHIVDNYRGISILCCIAKVFEDIIHAVLYNAARPLISDAQHGFVKKRSTVSNLMCYTTSLVEQMDKRCQVDSIYFDFSRAFDKVPHGLAIRKLNHLGLPSWITEWLSSYLAGREAFVKIGTLAYVCIASPQEFLKLAGIYGVPFNTSEPLPRWSSSAKQQQQLVSWRWEVTQRQHIPNGNGGDSPQCSTPGAPASYRVLPGCKSLPVIQSR
ncbi:uncharacterized protein LOC129766593 [Toxorhynchites rutilus septentrionalis]|uniref:uncharacterized protein LOC129766593 n=1 Tax=Toxorhynchites rutilus septentrionalis TaxID=329112 RepID=UPI00247A1786|nr:uncharacterized protein LOC129766593 [Toxorhynchites rutilus septentrionalis]